MCVCQQDFPVADHVTLSNYQKTCCDGELCTEYSTDLHEPTEPEPEIIVPPTVAVEEEPELVEEPAVEEEIIPDTDFIPGSKKFDLKEVIFRCIRALTDAIRKLSSSSISSSLIFHHF